MEVGGWKVKAGTGGGYLAIPFDAFKPPKLRSGRGFSHSFHPEGGHSLLCEQLTTHLPQASECDAPRKALRGGIPWSFLEPLGRSWRHFVGIYRQKNDKVSQELTLRYPHEGPCVGGESADSNQGLPALAGRLA